MHVLHEFPNSCFLALVCPTEINILNALDPLITEGLIPSIPPAAGPGVHEPIGDMVPAHAKAPSPSVIRQLTDRKSRVSPPPRVATEADKLICRTCGKPITRKKGQNGMTPKCCSAACLKEFKRIYARNNWRKRHGKPVDAPVRNAPLANPSDPFLTDEQRKEMMARREKLIAESARRHAED